MERVTLEDYLWGNRAKKRYLFLAAFFLLFIFLGSREIWTQEDRWATIVFGMFYRHDFLNPYIENQPYFDKPLLSYWLMALISQLVNVINTWTLRIPSALSGLLAIGSIYSIGTKLKNTQLGFLSAWILLTTYYFIFWARVANADMMNLAGCLFAISWYLNKKDQARFFDYAIFFLILALTALCKGLSGVMVTLIAVLIDLALYQNLRKLLQPVIIVSTVPALCVYFLPFWLTEHLNPNQSYDSLYFVYQENFLRYFQPFDHKEPFYIYFIYLPLYLLPWTFLFLPAFFSKLRFFLKASINDKWLMLTVFFIFLFFTLSGSRRHYYILPIIPFCILLTADWLLSQKTQFKKALKGKWFASLFIFLFLAQGVFPYYYYSHVSVKQFASDVQQIALQIQPWSKWQFVMIDTELKLKFYLQLPPTVLTLYTQTRKACLIPLENLLRLKTPNTIFITRQSNLNLLKDYFQNYYRVQMTIPTGLQFLATDKDAPIAFIPKR